MSTIIVSKKLLRLLGFGFGFGFWSVFICICVRAQSANIFASFFTFVTCRVAGSVAANVMF